MNAMLFLTLTLTVAQPTVPGPPTVPGAPPSVSKNVLPVQPPGYYDAWDEAIKQKKALVLFVGVPLRTVPGAVSCRIPELNGNSSPRILVCKSVTTATTPIAPVELAATSADAAIAKAVSSAKKFPTFMEMRPAIASGQGLPLIAFAGREPYDIPGATVTTISGIVNPNGTTLYHGILISRDGRGQQVIAGDSSDAEIRRVAGLGVSLTEASPFQPVAPSLSTAATSKTPKNAAPDRLQAAPVGANRLQAAPVGDVEDSPWLPVAEQKRMRKLLRALNVPVSDNLRFYKTEPVFQNMYTMNNGRSKFNDITPSDDPDPWRVSGGMHHINKALWRNVTGLDLPGQITYWQENTDVRAFSLVPKWRWKFPPGTLAYDVLIRCEDGVDKNVFEVRVQEKRATDWDDGTIYRPNVAVDDSKRVLHTWGFSDAGIAAKSTTYDVASISTDVPFIPSRTLAVSHDFTPAKYVGAGVACNTCHSKVGQILNVVGQIYLRAQRGDDGRFSWHPFDANGKIDARWPLAAR